VNQDSHISNFDPVCFLDQLAKPSEIKALDIPQLEQLAREIRQRIFDAVQSNGGHLASNLGVVELTLALHYCYDFGPHPTGPDRLLFDVGHQCYPHKMLTGRAKQFATLRRKGSIGGFPMPDESPYDLFAVGHAGTAISTAVGMARGDLLQHRKNHVVALVGDASIVNGVALEGLNNAGTLKRQLLIILNDNGMSISDPQGAFSEYLERVRVSTTYDQFKKLSEKVVKQMPGVVGRSIVDAWDSVRSALKGAMWHGGMFENFGIKYMGPIDGHDLPGLINFLAEIKHVDCPVVLHVKTTKGKGFEAAMTEPTRLHSPGAFSVEGGEGPELVGCRIEINRAAGKSWTTAFADAAIAVAKEHENVVALTAAMPDGTGLSKFEKAIPGRYFDTGICESHLVDMAAGMAKTGIRPVAAIYSTFVQRAYDQIWQEVILNNLPVVFAMDRAGFVGDDGAVHHGFMDQAFLRPLPGIVLMAPTDEAELNRMLQLGVSLDVASAIRYPRDNVPAVDFEKSIDANLQAAAGEIAVGRSRVLRRGSDATLIVYGALAETAMTVAKTLQEQDGISLEVIDARFCKPLDESMLRRVIRAGHTVVTLEDHAILNGFGTAVVEFVNQNNLPTEHVTVLGHPDRLIGHAKRSEQLAEVGLDVAGVLRSVRSAISRANKSNESLIV
jgi:1-deoxy-D-xylulose-5-phosphate synthase